MGIGFQQNEAYIPPIWPEEPGRQQMMAHLDFGVASREEMQDAVEKALRLGAEYAKAQYGGQDWTTMLDPCDYRAACHFEEGCGDRRRYRKGMRAAEFWNALARREEDEHGH